MFIGFRLGKRAMKAYKKHQAEKATREGSSENQHPSNEQHPSYDAFNQYFPPDNSARRNSSSSSNGSEYNTEEARALENDPEFKKFMEQQKALYLSQHQDRPPSYAAANRDNSHAVTGHGQRQMYRTSENEAQQHYNYHASPHSGSYRRQSLSRLGMPNSEANDVRSREIMTHKHTGTNTAGVDVKRGSRSFKE